MLQSARTIGLPRLPRPADLERSRPDDGERAAASV